MRHHAHVVHLAHLAILFHLHNLIVDALLVHLHLGELSAQFVTLFIGLHLQLLVQHVFEILVFIGNQLVLSQLYTWKCDWIRLALIDEIRLSFYENW